MQGESEKDIKYYVVKGTKLEKKYKRHKCTSVLSNIIKACAGNFRSKILSVYRTIKKQFVANYDKRILKIYIEPAE